MAENSFVNFFKKDIAGIPVWGWSLVIVAGVLVGVYFFKKNGSNPLSSFFSSGTSSSGQTGVSEAEQNLNGQSGNGTIPVTYNNPDTGFAQTSVNGQQVPILPPGYQPITDGNGSVIGYGPTAPTTTTTTGTGTASSLKTATTIAAGSLETTPHDAGGGKNILTVPSGANITFVGGPVPDPAGGSKQYYIVQYAGQTGFIGSNTLPPSPFGTSSNGSGRTYQTNILGL